MRISLKIAHTLATCGLIGGLAIHMLLLYWAPDAPVAYADLRDRLVMIGNYVLLPSLGVALFSGLMAMAAHRPYQARRWAWVKAALGILMFKGVLTIIGESEHAAAQAADVVAGTKSMSVFKNGAYDEWGTLWVVMVLSVANVVLGVWRPRMQKRVRAGATAT